MLRYTQNMAFADGLEWAKPSRLLVHWLFSLLYGMLMMMMRMRLRKGMLAWTK